MVAGESRSGVASGKGPPRLRYVAEALAVRLAFAFFASLSLDRASAVGGFLGRVIGPRLAVSRRAERNLGRALPELDRGTVRAIVRRMWDNLGRVVGEYPHLGDIDCYADDGRVEVIGAEHIDRLRDDGKGGIFFSAHIANWEIMPLAALQRGVELTHVYRAANNPLVEEIIQRVRTRHRGRYVAKGATGALRMLAALKDGGHLAMLVDNKYNEGIPVPFFGRDAMTAPTLAQLALRYDCPIVPARIERLQGARFRVTALPPLEVESSGDQAADVAATMRRVNGLLEEWIRERPEQWFWLHHRWPE